MDKSEPSLVPEWLRSTGGSTGDGNSSHHFSSTQTDGPLLALPKRTQSSKGVNNSVIHHSFSLDRSTSFNPRRSSSSNGYAKHDKNNFLRSYSSSTGIERDKGRERLTISDDWDAEYPYPLNSALTGRIEKDRIMRLPSPVSTKQSDVLQQRVNYDNGNGFVSVGSSFGGNQKVVFERDFPSLALDEKPSTPVISRVSSPGLSGSPKNLPIGNSTIIGGEGWTSALAEVPGGVGNNTRSSPAVQPAGASSVSCDVNTSNNNGLNMAEALVQAPARPHTAAQPSGQNQRLEELAVLQSRRLIPMTPSMSKASAVNPSDKLKSKTTVRSSEAVVSSKGGQQLQPLQLGSQPLNSVTSKSDGPKTSRSGKLHVLKPARENGVSPTLRDISSPTMKIGSRAANVHSVVAPSTASDPLKNQANPKHSPSELKTSPFGLMAGSSGDRKLASAQAQSRSDFFNLMRKKCMDGTPASSASSAAAVSSATMDKKNEPKDVASTPVSLVASSTEIKCNGDACSVTQRFPDAKENDSSVKALIYPDEEEAAFLRSLGWEENAGDDEGLTEEEIKAFYDKMSKRGLRLKIPTQSGPQAACSGGASSS